MSEGGLSTGCSESSKNSQEYKPAGYIVVKESAPEDEPIELELEDDGNLRMSTLISQFSGACGLRYRNKESGAMRGVRLHNELFLPPNGEKGWPLDVVFNVVYQKRNANGGEGPNVAMPKRKICEKVGSGSDDGGGEHPKSKRPSQNPSDLAVLSLPWRTQEDDLKNYFGKFGTVVFADIKRHENGNSKGFGFIRFESYEGERKAIAEKNHEIDGRQIVLRTTRTAKQQGESTLRRKVFVGRLSVELGRQDLLDYFSQFGQITDVNIPQPFRSFGFITFQNACDAISILDRDHLINGHSVVTRSADPVGNQSSGVNSPAAATNENIKTPPGSGPVIGSGGGGSTGIAPNYTTFPPNRKSQNPGQMNKRGGGGGMMHQGFPMYGQSKSSRDSVPYQFGIPGPPSMTSGGSLSGPIGGGGNLGYAGVQGQNQFSRNHHSHQYHGIGRGHQGQHSRRRADFQNTGGGGGGSGLGGIGGGGGSGSSGPSSGAGSLGPITLGGINPNQTNWSENWDPQKHHNQKHGWL